MTLRLWIDPEGRDVERACCSPEAVRRRARDLPRARDPARHARPARGVPAGDRRAVRARLRARRDAEPLHPLQRLLPLRTAARASRATREPRASRRATTRGSSSTTDACCSPAPQTPRRTSRTCSRGSIRASSTALWFPLGEQGRRRRAPRPRARGSRPPAGRRARRRASSAATTTARSSSATGSQAEEGRRRRRGRPGPRTHDGFWRFTPGQRKGLGVAAGVAGVRAADRSAAERRRRRAARRRWRARGVRARGRLFAPRRRASTSSSATARRRSGPGGGERARFRAVAGRARVRRCPGQAAVLYDGDVVVGAGRIVSSSA